MQLIPLTDSRSLTDPARTQFFALRTAMGDGHQYIPELYSRGVRHFVVQPDFAIPADMSDAEFIIAESPLMKLQELAAERRKSFAGKVIGITGSRGKTMVKEWLNMLLSPDHAICRSPRSFNSQIGVPLSVMELDGAADLGIFEAGISKKGEMEALNRIISPDIAVITSIAADHDAGFSSPDEKIAEKAAIARGASVVVFPADNKELAAYLKKTYPQARMAGWSMSGADAFLKIETEVKDRHTKIIFRTADDRRSSFRVEFTEPWQVSNLAACLAVMLTMGYSPEMASMRLSRLVAVDTRLSVSNAVNNCLAVHDNYPCDLHSLGVALDFIDRRITPDRTLTVILSDIDIEGGNLERTYSEVGKLLRMRGVSRLIGVGREISAHFAEMEIPGAAYKSTEEFLYAVTPTDFSSELILVKGSPEFNFATIVALLDAKTHETVLEVNLDAMVENFNFFRMHLKPSTGIVAMVKASGYGAGSLELAKTLQAHGAAYLAVAVGDEGEELRKAGISMPIMVLNPMVLNYKQLFNNYLEPEIFSFESLSAIIYEADRLGITDYPIHIKLDTGMHRLGFREEEIPRLLEILDNQRAVRVRSVFSHLATADCLDMDAYTLGQLQYFDRASSKIVEHFPYKVLRHLLNTAGILRFPDYQYDMVRLGIGLYGIPVVNDGREEPLRPISALRSVVIALRRWTPDETIGYGRRGILNRESVIATVPIGYADGFNRHCGRGMWKVAIKGHLCPTVGNICMDLCMVDVTDVPDIRIGDPVYIFGPDNPVVKMAELLDTIPYECLTAVSPRVRRVYFRES